MDEKIEEMAKIISSDICDKDCSNRCAFCGANAKKEAKNLYNAGYRKESDTARDVIGDLAELIINHSGRLNLEDLYEIAEKYGVKVG